MARRITVRALVAPGLQAPSADDVEVPVDRDWVDRPHAAARHGPLVKVNAVERNLLASPATPPEPLLADKPERHLPKAFLVERTARRAKAVLVPW